MKMNLVAKRTSKMLLMPNKDLSMNKNRISLLSKKISKTLKKFKMWIIRRREMTWKRIGVTCRSKSFPTAPRKEMMQILLVRVSQWSKEEATMALNSKTSREHGTTNNEMTNTSGKNNNIRTDYSQIITKPSSKNTTISPRNQTTPITTKIKRVLGTTMTKALHNNNKMEAKNSFTRGMIATNTSKSTTNTTQGRGNSLAIINMRCNTLETKTKDFKTRDSLSSPIRKNLFQARIFHRIHSWSSKSSKYFTASSQRLLMPKCSSTTPFRINSLSSSNSNNKCTSSSTSSTLATTSKSTPLSTTMSSRCTTQQPKLTLRVTSEVSQVQKDTCLILCLFQSCNSNDRQLAAAYLRKSRTLCCFDSDDVWVGKDMQSGECLLAWRRIPQAWEHN